MNPQIYENLGDAFSHQRLLLKEKKNIVVFDIGAYVGNISLKYASLFPDATIFSFEPFNESFAQLKEKAAKGDYDIRPFKLALADKSYKTKLHVNTYTPTNSLLPSHEAAASHWGENLLETRRYEEISVTTVSEFCNREKIDYIDILKLDTQGTEYDVLKGAEKMLKTRKIGLIYMEILLADTYVGQKTLPEITELLAQFGYRLFNIYNPMISKEGNLNQIDAIFLPYKENE